MILRTVFAILFFSSFLTHASANEDSIETDHRCSMSAVYEEYGFDEVSFSIAADSLEEWLINSFYPQFNAPYPSEVFYSIRPHLKDTDKNFIDTEEFQLDRLKFKNNQIFEKRGRITYVGIVQKGYRYRNQIVNGDEIKVSVKVHIKNATAAEFDRFNNAIELAEGIWNNNKVDFGFNYSFDFELVSAAKDAFFSVKLVDNLRGPYDTYWNRNWSAKTIAHEMGHMMGLGDEYQTLTGKSYCLNSSMMCSSWGQPHSQHYYHVLRRLFKN